MFVGSQYHWTGTYSRHTDVRDRRVKFFKIKLKLDGVVGHLRDIALQKCKYPTRNIIISVETLNLTPFENAHK